MANGKFEDITGQRFGKLTVTKRIENKDNRPYFLCTCDCGKTKDVSSQNLKKGSVQSCGCFRRESKFKDLTGQIFNRFTVIKENGFLGEGKAKKSAFLCKCVCGEEKTVRGADLLSGKIVSCGCWRDEKAIENIAGVDTTVEDPIKSSAIKTFQRNYNDGNLTFEQFMNLSQKNCFYCNVIKSNNYNTFKYIKASAKSSLENGNFNYSGLDRVDATKKHDIENLVPCCKKCNMAKSNMTIEEFKTFVINSFNNLNKTQSNICDNNKYLNYLKEFKINDNSNRKHHPSISSAKDMFKNYNDDDCDLTFKIFLSLSQHNCVYCDAVPANCYNEAKIRDDSSEYAKQNGNFVYNGLDRVDPNLPHNINNIVPCCFKCNWSKSNNTLEEYKDWVIRVYNHLIKK